MRSKGSEESRGAREAAVADEQEAEEAAPSEPSFFVGTAWKRGGGASCGRREQGRRQGQEAGEQV